MLTNVRRKYFGDTAFYKMLLGVAFPIMVQNGMSNFVNLLDNIMVGQLGTEQMSGVAIVNQLIFIFYLFIFGGVSGVGIFTAQYYGNNDIEGIKHTFRYKLWLGFIITVSIILLLLKWGPTIIGLYLTNSEDGENLEATLNYGIGYLSIILFMLPLVYITQVYCSTLRECGETKVPMIAGVSAVLSNLVLDYLLIFGKFGLPALGVKGAALATCIARLIELSIVLIWCNMHKNTHTYLKGLYTTIKIPSKLVGKYFITGIPLLLNEGLWSVGIAMLNQAYSVRGLNVVAGMNIATTINNLFNIFFVAMGDAVAIIIGQHLGAGDMKKAKEDDTKIIAFAVMSTICIGAIMFCLSGVFPKFYTGVNDMARLVAMHFIMVQAIAMPKDAFLHTSYFTIRAGGKTIITFLFDSVFILLVSVPLANALVHFTNLGPATIFAMVHAADLLKCTLGFILVKKGVWMRNIVA